MVLSSLDPRGGFSYLILPPGPACFRPTVPLEFRSGTVCHMLRLVSYQSSFNLTNYAGHECRNRPWGTFRQPSGPPHRFRRLMTALRSSSTVSDTSFQINSNRWPSEWSLTLQPSHLSHQRKVIYSYCRMNSRLIFCLWFHFSLTLSQSLFQQSSEKNYILPLPFINHHTPLFSSSIATYAPRNDVVGVLNDSPNRALWLFALRLFINHHTPLSSSLIAAYSPMLLVYWMTLCDFSMEKSPYYPITIESCVHHLCLVITNSSQRLCFHFLHAIYILSLISVRTLTTFWPLFDVWKQ